MFVTPKYNQDQYNTVLSSIERWKLVTFAGYFTGYQISNKGRVSRVGCTPSQEIDPANPPPKVVIVHGQTFTVEELYTKFWKV